MKKHHADITPDPARLLHSLRDVGYDFATALADIVDNSIAAGADRISVRIAADEAEPYVIVADNGSGMTSAQLVEALRLGSRRDYGESELGKFGLGLKTASLSQCRRLVVATRHSKKQYRISSALLDLDNVSSAEGWILQTPQPSLVADLAGAYLNTNSGTAIKWEKLDRVFSHNEPACGWDKRRLNRLIAVTSFHLSMVFHRFMQGSHNTRKVQIRLNGEKLTPWDPFALTERHTTSMTLHTLEVGSKDHYRHTLTAQGFVLPARDNFSSQEAFDRLSGPKKWNRQQGFYIYRNNRLIQSGGWCGMRAPDEHTKLARIAINFPSVLDDLFKVNIAKMRVAVPLEVKSMLERIVQDVVRAAQLAYRSPLKLVVPPERSAKRADSVNTAVPSSPQYGELMLGLRAAALATGESDSLTTILRYFRSANPELASAAGISPESFGRPLKKHRASTETG